MTNPPDCDALCADVLFSFRLLFPCEIASDDPTKLLLRHGTHPTNKRRFYKHQSRCLSRTNEVINRGGTLSHCLSLTLWQQGMAEPDHFPFLSIKLRTLAPLGIDRVLRNIDNLTKVSTSSNVCAITIH